MKFLHIADLHIGKTLNAFSLLEDQEYALSQILEYVKLHRPGAVAIAGDVYDKQTPSPDAVRVFDGFLTGLARLGVSVMIISGNHDSPERLGFASGIMGDSGVYLYGVFDGTMRAVTLSDEFGEIRFYMLPYIRPADVRRFYPDAAADGGDPAELEHRMGGRDNGGMIESYQDAVGAVIGAAEIDGSVRNVLIAHQFISAEGADPERSESERETVGGTDRIDADAAGITVKFDYAALGHLHGSQRIGTERVRYAGSPLKYSFSECFHNKCALLVELRAKGDLTVTSLPIIPLRDLRRIRGRLDDLLKVAVDEQSGNDDYLQVVLTDDEEAFDAIGRLRAVYPNVMRLDYDNARANAEYDVSGEAGAEYVTPLSMFEEFYAAQNGTELNGAQLKTVADFLDAESP